MGTLVISDKSKLWEDIAPILKTSHKVKFDFSHCKEELLPLHLGLYRIFHRTESKHLFLGCLPQEFP